MSEKKENLPIADKNYSREYLAELRKLGSNSVRDGINLLVICVKYYRFKRVFPALKGRATLFIPDLKMIINEVNYFEKDGKRWVRLPQFFSGHATDKTKMLGNRISNGRVPNLQPIFTNKLSMQLR